MAGIYIHIPFCRRRCFYCDFYKTTQTAFKSFYIEALLNELNLRKSYLQNEIIDTIYFGGGTPSVLTPPEIEKILAEIYGGFNMVTNPEITLEANPDDLDVEYLSRLAETKINRLSIGIQSFFDEDLKQMNRRHNSLQASGCVNEAFSAGFKNISIDLIYGLPGLTLEKWGENLKQAFVLPVSHLSAYHLTYHEGTRFFDLKKKGFLQEIPEDDSVAQFELLIDKALENNFFQYEISNFAKEGAISKHNSAYWSGKKYLGLGPSAHSYDGSSRQWNVSDVGLYIENIKKSTPLFELEILSENERYNDYIITNLRTMWGISEEYIKNSFGETRLRDFKKEIGKYLKSGFVYEKGGFYFLSKAGLFISDEITSALLSVE